MFSLMLYISDTSSEFNKIIAALSVAADQAVLAYTTTVRISIMEHLAPDVLQLVFDQLCAGEARVR